MRPAVLLALATLECVIAYAAVSGVVTIDNRPFKGAVVKVEVPGVKGAADRVFVTRTLANGRFSVPGADGRSAIISVLQDGKLVYRNYYDPRATSIDLQSAGPRLPSGFSPVALAMLVDNIVTVSSEDGQLYRFQNGKFLNAVRPGIHLRDIASSRAGVLFGCTDGSPGMLVQLDSSFRVMRRWRIGAGSTDCSAVAIDPISGAVYAVNAKEMELYRLVRADGAALFFTKLDRVMMSDDVASLAVDEMGQTLFIGDPGKGGIFAVDLRTRVLRQFAHGLGNVRALAIDSTARRLYAADSSKDRVWQFDLTRQTPAAGNFVGADNVRSAYALGVGRNGDVWVGDQKYDALFAFSRTGQLKVNLTAK